MIDETIDVYVTTPMDCVPTISSTSATNHSTISKLDSIIVANMCLEPEFRYFNVYIINMLFSIYIVSTVIVTI